MENKFCNIPDCNDQDFSLRLYNGVQFCTAHYNEKFIAELMSHLEAWDGTIEPPDRLKYLIGRYYGENEIALIGQPSLTKDIVHRRAYNWLKTKDGIVFTTVRYPVDKKKGYPFCVEVHQTWLFNIRTLTYTFLSEGKK